MCRRPEELLMVTFNHLDGMREYVGGSPEHVHIINSVHKRTREVRQALGGEGGDSKGCAPMSPLTGGVPGFYLGTSFLGGRC